MRKNSRPICDMGSICFPLPSYPFQAVADYTSSENKRGFARVGMHRDPARVANAWQPNKIRRRYVKICKKK